MTRSPVVLGLDFGGTKIAVAVGDLSGRRLGVTTIESLAEVGAEAAMARGLAAARDLLADVAPGQKLAAVGAATLGIPYDDRVELAPTFPGWGEIAFGQLVRDAFPGVPVRLGTDVKAAAAAELRWGALADCDPGIYLNLGTGLAAAIVAGGTVISGAHGASGEIGYNLRTAADVWIDQRGAHDPGGRRQRSGARGGRQRPVGRAGDGGRGLRAGREPAGGDSPTSSTANWRCMSSIWPSPSTRSGSSSAADWSAPGIGSPPGCAAHSTRRSPSHRS